VTHLLVDTGFLVALSIRGDSLHQAAVGLLKGNRLPLQTLAPVIVETWFFLDPKGKAALLTWIAQGGLAVAHSPTNRYPNLADYINHLRA
jgi:predicted nucleic acid-binding protein